MLNIQKRTVGLFPPPRLHPDPAEDEAVRLIKADIVETDYLPTQEEVTGD
jgi:hypothetical protein